MSSGKLIIASGEACADLRYASGFSTPDDFIWFAAQDICGVVMSSLEYNRAKSAAAPGVSVFSEEEMGGPGRLEIIQHIAAAYRLSGFIVPEDFPLIWADRIRSCGLTVTPAAERFFPEREFKSAREAEQITRSLRAAEAGCRRAFEVLRETEIASDGTLLRNGSVLTSEELRFEIDSTMMKLGMLPTGTICAGGFQGSQPHNAGSGPLYAHTPIVMDIFPRSAENGYWGDLTRTVVRGKPKDIVKKAYDAVQEARETAKKYISPDAACADIHKAAAAVLEKYGFYTGRNEKGDYGFFHGLGHGVGLDIHELPRLSPRYPGKLKPGAVVTIEPGLYYPEWGGIRLEDMVFLDETGNARCLTQIEDFLIL
ncbi:MAG: M24 family metallopeptidase [Lentisphaeria bacterium]|nr:M24 family metallopeptidase [Lentisphaeria bacterium]